MPEAGELKIGGLEISDILGIGYSGLTYRAKDQQSRDVIIKVIKWEYSPDETLLEHLQLLSLRNLKHPNLSPIFDVGTTETGKVWYTRPFYECESVHNMIKQLDVNAVLYVLFQIGDALDCLHRNGLAHGCIRTDNIKLLRQNPKETGTWWTPRLTEFPYQVIITGFGVNKPSDPSRANPPMSPKDDIRALGKLICTCYGVDCDDGSPDNKDIKTSIPEKLQSLVSRLLGVGHEEPITSMQQFMQLIPDLAAKPAGELTLSRLPKSIVGRKTNEKKALLKDLFQESQTSGKAILIESDDGNGKTHLVREFAADTTSDGHHMSIVSCMFRFNPLEPILRFNREVAESIKVSNLAVLKNYETVLAQMEGKTDLPVESLLLDQKSLFEAYLTFLTEVSNIKPICLIIEDIHTASESMLKLICHILPSISQLKMLLVLTSNPTRVRGDQQFFFDRIASSDDMTKILIGPIDFATASGYMKSMLDAPDLSENVIQSYFESSSGNLQKLNELIKLSVVQGALTLTSGHLTFAEKKFAEIKKWSESPIFVGKLSEHLEETESMLLRLLTILGGRATSSTILNASKNIPGLDRLENLAITLFSLVSKGVVKLAWETGITFFDVESESYFDYIVNSTPPILKKELYDGAFKALSMSSYELPEKDASICQLALKGNDAISAFKTSLQAYASCARQLCFPEAVFFLNKLIQMIPEHEKTYIDDCQVKKALCMFGIGEYNEASEIFSRTQSLSPDTLALKAMASFHAKQPKTALFFNELAADFSKITDIWLKRQFVDAYLSFLQDTDPQKALYVAGELSSIEEPHIKTIALLASSRIRMALADFEEAEKAVVAASLTAKSTGLPVLQAKCELWQIKLALMKGDNEKAGRLIRRSSGLIQSCFDLEIRAEFHQIAGQYFRSLPDLSTALLQVQAQVRCEAKTGNRKNLAKAMFELGTLLDSKGLSKEAQHSIEKARRIAEDASDNLTIGRALSYIGDFYFENTQVDQALISLERSEKILTDLSDFHYLAKTYESLGRIWLSKQDIEKSRKYAKLLGDLAESTYEPMQKAVSSKLQGAIAMFQEKWDKAEECFIKTLQYFEDRGLQRESNNLKIELADLFVKQGEYFRALSKLAEARLFFEEENAPREIKRIRTAEMAIDKEIGKYGEDYRNLRMLLEISKVLAQITDISELLPMIVDMAIKVSGAERGFVMMISGPGKLDFAAGRNKNKETLRHEEFAFSKSVTDSVLETKKTVSITDTASDDKFKARDSIVGLSLRSIMCGPMKMGENVLGLIYVDSQVPTFYFSRKNAEFFEALCSHAAFAVNSARLFQQIGQYSTLQDENKHLRETLKQRKQLLSQIKIEIDTPFKTLFESLGTIDRNPSDPAEVQAQARSAKNSLLLIKASIEELLGSENPGKAI